MKYLCILLSSLLLLSFAGNNSFVDREQNQDGTLRYLILSDEDDDFNSQILLLAKNEKMDIEITTDKKRIVDYTIEVEDTNEGEEEILNRVLSDIREKFYTGKPPTYSTIFKNGTEGYAVYRIPSIIMTKDKILVAFAEARGVGKTDSVENDIVAKRSFDGGKTWSPLILAVAAGEASLHNPSVIYIEAQDKILIMFQLFPPKTFEATTRSGIEGKNICRSFTSESYDDGESWSEGIDITTQVKKEDMNAICSGPGIGISLKGGKNPGRIIFPYNTISSKHEWYNYLVYSDDFGKNWKIAEGQSWYGTNESQVVQIDEDKLRINARSHRYKKNPSAEKTPFAWSPWNFTKLTPFRAEIPVEMDGDEFSFGSTIIREDMPDPQCQGSFYRFSGLDGDEESILLFSNPASNVIIPVKGKSKRRTPPARINGSVKISYDNGVTWDNSKRIYGNRWTGFQYSVLVKVSDEEVGVIFECYPEIKFAHMGLDWLEK